MHKTYYPLILLCLLFSLAMTTSSCSDGNNDVSENKNNIDSSDDNSSDDGSTDQDDNQQEDDDFNNPLVTKNATTETINLFHYLQAHYGKDIISASMANVDWNTNECEWVYRHTGKYPAMAGFDFISIYNQEAKYKDISPLVDWHSQHGLITLMWHWNIPRTEGTSSNYGFYSLSHHNSSGTNQYSNITPDVVNDSTSWGYKYLVNDMKKVADVLLRLQEVGIPVLWRPLHEASGGWFWWGAADASSYKKLWRLMYQVFQEKGVKNTIWVWTSEINDKDWYPGDQYVDLIGRDKYNENNSLAIGDEYRTLVANYPTKMVTLSECGQLANIPSQWDAEAKWSWFMPWYDYDRTKDNSSASSSSHKWADIVWWQAALNQSNCITRDEINLN